MARAHRCKYGIDNHGVAGGGWGYWAMPDGRYDQCRLWAGEHEFHFIETGPAVSTDGSIWIDDVSWMPLHDNILASQWAVPCCEK